MCLKDTFNPVVLSYLLIPRLVLVRHYLNVLQLYGKENKTRPNPFSLYTQLQVCIMLHSGSRGLGHQVATDALVQMEKAMARDKIHINDRQVRFCCVGPGRRGGLSCLPGEKGGPARWGGRRGAVYSVPWCRRQAMALDQIYPHQRVVPVCWVSVGYFVCLGGGPTVEGSVQPGADGGGRGADAEERWEVLKLTGYGFT